EVEELLHVMLLERLGERHVEGRWNVGQVEVYAVPLGGRVDAVEVADALVLDQRRDGAPRYGQSLPLHVRPIRIEPRVADDEQMALALDAGLSRELRKPQGRRIGEDLRAGAAVDVHFLVGLP